MLIHQPNQLQAKEFTLFPAKDSIDEAVNYCNSKMPIEDSQTLFSLLAMYHNTLLKQNENQNLSSN